MGLDRLIGRRAPVMDMERLRKARPVRNEFIEEETQEDGSIVLVAPLEEQGRGMMALMARWMKLPPEKKFELEPVGAFVWSLCDGSHTVDAIARKLRERYKMNRLEADAALAAFLRMLGQRRLISLQWGKDK